MVYRNGKLVFARALYRIKCKLQVTKTTQNFRYHCLLRTNFPYELCQLLFILVHCVINWVKRVLHTHIKRLPLICVNYLELKLVKHRTSINQHWLVGQALCHIRKPEWEKRIHNRGSGTNDNTAATATAAAAAIAYKKAQYWLHTQKYIAYGSKTNDMHEGNEAKEKTIKKMYDACALHAFRVNWKYNDEKFPSGGRDREWKSQRESFSQRLLKALSFVECVLTQSFALVRWLSFALVFVDTVSIFLPLILSRSHTLFRSLRRSLTGSLTHSVR